MGQTVSHINTFFQRKKIVATPPKDDGQDITKKSLVITSSANTSFIHAGSLPKFLVTPRSPLRRGTRPLTPSESLPGRPPSKRLKGDTQYLDFPVLVDDRTIHFVQNNKVMFIMKGVPGSGKSFIAKKIKEVYRDAVLCSADYYFMQDGEYHFEVEKLKDAHGSCQDAARKAVEEGCHVILIDNTNVRNWEMNFYLDLAQEQCYIPLVLEPQTPWVMDCSELAYRNAHNLPEDIIAQKIKNYQPVLPLYYGWFLNEEDSKQIGLMGQMWLQEAMKVDSFIQDFSQMVQLTTTGDIFRYFSLDKYVDERHMLHVTAKYTARGKVEGAMHYIASPLIKRAMGRCSRLHIIGFVITPRTIGARLRLTEEQLELWGNDDHEDPPETEKTRKETPDNMDGEHVTSEEKTACRPTISAEETREGMRFHPTSGKGSRAHLTLACAPGVKPVNTGFNLISVIRCEQRCKEWLTESCKQKMETFNLINGGVLRTYGEGLWVVYPEREIVVTSMFSACY